MKLIKVLIADDSVLMRLLISDILNADSQIQVVEMVANGKQAHEKVLEMKPDVAILDINMGEYDGKYAVEKIMQDYPIPIIIVSSVGNSDMKPVMECLELGAFDYVNKPVKDKTKMEEVQEELTRKIKASVGASITAHTATKVKENVLDHTFDEGVFYDVIVIGSSTGGPSALEAILAKLPRNLPIPVLIAQHMPPNFVPTFVSRLNELYPLEIVMGKKDDILKPGRVIIAPGSHNMIVRRDVVDGNVYIDFSDQSYDEYNFPSVNALMLSVAEVYGNRTIGVILTGMGKDGSHGMKRIKEVGGYTIAQDKETSVVFGMPKEAIINGSINQVLPIQEIGNFVVSCLN